MHISLFTLLVFFWSHQCCTKSSYEADMNELKFMRSCVRFSFKGDLGFDAG